MLQLQHDSGEHAESSDQLELEAKTIAKRLAKSHELMNAVCQNVQLIYNADKPSTMDPETVKAFLSLCTETTKRQT